MRTFRTRTWLGVVAVLTGLGLLLVAPPSAGAQAASKDAYADPGPYRVESTGSGETTFFYPVSDEKHPVILWGNGTGTTTTIYRSLLEHFASHGFVVAAYNSSNASFGGAGLLPSLAEIQNVPAVAERADVERVGATGHSQGGIAALQAGEDPKVDTAFPLQGCFGLGSGDVPTIYFAGQNDAIASPAVNKGCYDRASYPAAYAEVAGAGHLAAAGNGGDFRGAATAWALWQLKGDATAASLFIGGSPGLAADSDYSSYAANDALMQLQVPGASSPAPASPAPAEPAPATPAPATPAPKLPQPKLPASATDTSAMPLAKPASPVVAEPTYTG